MKFIAASRRCERPLVDVEISRRRKPGFGVRQVQLPHPVEDLVEAQLRHGIPAIDEALPPYPQRLGVVRSQ